MNVLTYFENQRKSVALLAGLGLIAAIGVVDYLTGAEIAFSIFYVLPISLVAWIAGLRFGLAASVTSAAVWYGAEVASRTAYSHHLIPIWNSLIRLAFFVIITLLLSSLKKALQRESELARVDNLTGAANARHFYELVQFEFDRCQRYQHPFTLAYIDIDDFKSINDRFGHLGGDHVLRTVVASLKPILRKTDLLGRLGGDEFAILLPETGKNGAPHALAKIQAAFAAPMLGDQSPVTASIGVLTCDAAPPSIDALVKLADDLMYAAKRDGKNQVRYDHYSG